MEKKEMKLWKKLLLLVLVVVIITLIYFAVTLTRKHLIVKDLEAKIADNASRTNYYVKLNRYFDESYSVLEYYVKDDKYLEKDKVYADDNVVKCDFYTIDGKTYKYIENGVAKIVEEEKNDYIANPYLNNVVFGDYFKTESKSDYLKLLMDLEISTEYVNGKECYKVKLPEYQGVIMLEEGEKAPELIVYIEKDTGLTIRDYNKEIVDYSYEFDTVKDEVFTKTDASEYKVVE